MDGRLLLRPLRVSLQSHLRKPSRYPTPAFAIASAASQTRHNASIASEPPPPVRSSRSSKSRSSSSTSSSPSTPQSTIFPVSLTAEPPTPADPEIDPNDVLKFPDRYPRNVQALYLQPLRRQATYGVPSCDLQLRSYSIRPLNFFSDFALRAAYYLGLAAYGPVPLPKITERWTVPKSNFIFKKSQENFERITRRRLIQIRDGHPETVQIWLAFLQKHQQYGVGMKANMWEYSGLDVAKELEEGAEAAKDLIEPKLKLMGMRQGLNDVEEVDEMLARERIRLAGGR